MADLLAYGEDIIGFPGGEATAKVKLMKLLWENPDLTASFEEQNITISSPDYDYLLVIPIWLKSTNPRTTSPILFPKGMKGAYLNFGDDSVTYGAMNYYRPFVRVSDTVFTVGGCRGNKNTFSNDYLIPYQIYGIKLEQEIPVVAENVSTLAANCLLSDGETSVEDKIDEMETSFQDALDDKIDASRRILHLCSWQSSGASDLSFFNVPNVGASFAPIAKIVNSDGSFTVYGFLSTGFYKATFNSSGVYQSNTKIG